MIAEEVANPFIIENDGRVALGASEDVVVPFLKPSALFEELMAALRIRASEPNVGV